MNDTRKINFLFCNHPLYSHKVDEDYADEYEAAGVNHSCALFSYENLERGKLSLYGEQISGLAVYRGWMMKPEMYRVFYNLLKEKNIILINSPEEYEHYHTLPGWYNESKDYTAKSVWETEGRLSNALEMAKGLEGSYIVKDFVKSRKHEWKDACFIPDIADRTDAARVIGNFIARQDTTLTGGIVLRKFQKLKQIGFHEKSGMPLSEEYRVFIYKGRVLIVDDYWCKSSEVRLSEDEREWIEALASRVRSNFVTMDVARREDGQLIIMEFGDGQVSGLQQIEAKTFYEKFDSMNE